MGLLEGRRQGEVIQPVALRLAPRLEGISWRPSTTSPAIGGNQQPAVLVIMDNGEIDLRRVGGDLIQVLPIEPALLDKILQSDEKGVAGEGARGLIRRPTWTRRAKGEELP